MRGHSSFSSCSIKEMFQLSDYTYDLPDERIAQLPADPPDHCRLLVYTPGNTMPENTIQDLHFYDLPNLLPSQSMITFNTSKVIKARLLLDTKREIFFLQHHTTHTENAHIENTFEALVRPGKEFRVGTTITRDPPAKTPSAQINPITFTVIKQTQHGRILSCSEPIDALLETYGQLPLPPYIAYSAEKASSYQPIVAQEPWSVAAPTASLHFTPALLEQLHTQGIVREEVTLHIWLGTFQSVQTDDITKHDIHSERIVIDTGIFGRIAQHKRSQKEITATWTTVMRTLESLPFLRVALGDIALGSKDENIVLTDADIAWRDQETQDISLQGTWTFIHDIVVKDGHIYFSTKIFLYPWTKIRVVDGLITNFHLPKSSLLMLVAAFVGFDEMKRIYAHALARDYMFYSFGDAMYLKKQ